MTESPDLNAPLAPVLDPLQEEPKRPSEVRTAVGLGAGALVLGLIHAVLTLDRSITLIHENYAGIAPLAEIPDSTWKLSILASAVFGAFFMALVLLGLWFRKNWVRWSYLVLVAMSALGFVFSALVSASLGPISNAIRSIQTALWVVSALYLLRPTAKSWFKPADRSA